MAARTKNKTTPFAKIRRGTRRLCFRPYLLTDYRGCVASHGRRLSKQNPFDDGIRLATVADYEEYKKTLLELRGSAKDGGHFLFGLFLKKDMQHIGEISFFVINKQMKWANLGYQVNNQFWGKGFATEAAKAALQVGFDDLGFHRIEAGMQPENIASRRVVEKSGMHYEGVRRNFFFHSGGVDLHMFAQNKIEFHK